MVAAAWSVSLPAPLLMHTDGCCSLAQPATCLVLMYSSRSLGLVRMTPNNPTMCASNPGPHVSWQVFQPNLGRPLPHPGSRSCQHFLWTQPCLSPDSSHIYVNKCCSLAWAGLSPAPSCSPQRICSRSSSFTFQ